MHKPCFITLAVKWPGTYTATCWHPYHYVGILSPSVMQFCEVINDLVKTDCNKIGELHFHHRLITFQRKAQCCTNNGAFANGCIAHPGLSKCCCKTFCYFKSAAIFRNILSH